MFRVVSLYRLLSPLAAALFLECVERSRDVFAVQEHEVTRAVTCTMSSPANSAPRFTAGRLSRSEKARESLERNVSRGESSDAGK